jgi:hypothetical protein
MFALPVQRTPQLFQRKAINSVGAEGSLRVDLYRWMSGFGLPNRIRAGPAMNLQVTVDAAAVVSITAATAPAAAEGRGSLGVAPQGCGA